jgi:hypothetical protein
MTTLRSGPSGPDVPGIFPSDCFMLDVEVGEIGALGSVSALLTDSRFAYTPAAGAEWLPVTASLDVDDPDNLLIVNVTVVDAGSGQIRIRFFNCTDAIVDFSQRFVTFFVWPPVAEPAP